ncbi:MAG TPA: cation transporter [Pirellulales bacterium]
MKTLYFALSATLACWMLPAAMVQADVTVKISGLHNCCGSCLKGITKAVKSAGAQAEMAKGDDTLTLTAPDKATAQKALDKLAAAGYHGTSDTPGLAIKDDSGAPAGKTTRLVLSGAHNCCGGCADAIKDAAGNVPGVSGQTVNPKSKTFVVEGNYDAKALVQALNDAGFHVKVATE